jgi:hypothetical protein
MVPRLLRALAIAIAVAAFVDPAVTSRVLIRQPLTIVTMDARDVVHAERLQRRLSDSFEVAIHVDDPASLAAACPSSGGCVLVSRGDVPRRMSAGASVLGALRVTTEDAGRTIRRVVTPATVHRDAASSLKVTLSRPVGRVDVLDGDVLVGSVEPGASLDVDVPWVPLGAGARALRVVAESDVEDVGVVVEATPAEVFVYEPEPTWMGTFVRRAIEDDSRFVVAGRTRVAPPVTVTRGGAGPLSAATIGDAGAVVVTAPHTLGATDVELLDRFVTQRGGSLIIVPDQRPSGAVLRLFPRVAGQQRDAQPRDVGLLRVREWLTFEPGVGTTTLAALAGDPIVVSRAVGRGRVIVSGALDAWRFRDATSGFNAYWSGLVWEAAVAAGKPLHLSAERALARPGEPIRIEAVVQSIDRMPRELSASGTMTCGDRREVVRWWPGGRPGTFEGVVRPTVSGQQCEVSVTVDDVTTSLRLAVRADLRRGSLADDALEAAVQAHGAIVVENGDGEDSLLAHASAQLPAAETSASVWPMRSPFWLIVFVACLSSEWWLRRRAGLS